MKDKGPKQRIEDWTGPVVSISSSVVEVVVTRLGLKLWEPWPNAARVVDAGGKGRHDEPEQRSVWCHMEQHHSDSEWEKVDHHHLDRVGVDGQNGEGSRKRVVPRVEVGKKRKRVECSVEGIKQDLVHHHETQELSSQSQVTGRTWTMLKVNSKGDLKRGAPLLL